MLLEWLGIGAFSLAFAYLALRFTLR